MRDGYLAPIKTDSLGEKYVAENIEAFVENLPDFLLQREHPQYYGKTNLLSCKGIIYLPNVQWCERASEILRKRNINSYTIHSKKDNKSDIARFKKSDCGILLACQMCRYGFDDPQLAYVIIAQNPSDPSLVLQMVGRVAGVDLDKIGYVL
ncbi:helicase-related protein [Candidatus Berkiella aquae]|uniref:Helicase C-terminal domain-containing protein n=1 Tax=Candidatus Berkiella aquae TaxID=295108 RepID=A0A0Q9YLX4_9GAMM|nr:helicase-related protein [Candidatus Berkiella aquae]MCS5710580.1 hypothetical protein [Candidatus Berkiella aquae]